MAVQSTKPNILLIQADQMSAQSMPFHGNAVVKAPTLERLASDGVVFANCYCNFPLCAPSRFSMLSGQLSSKIKAYDNGAEFQASVPTVAHYLRNIGYYTCLIGKMHFIGPDQLHGFEARLTTDIYPSDFSWTADWGRGDAPPTREMRVVQQAGPCRRSVQIDFDDDVAFQAQRALYDIARDRDARPFFIVASFTHPHDPFSISEPYWNLYSDAEIDLPRLPRASDPQSERIRRHFGIDEAGITEAQLRNARRAYYGAISYLDEKITDLVETLDRCGLLENTIVFVTSDHGEFLGERGLWFKRSFFEESIRVPLIVYAPSLFSSREIASNVSLIDLLPTMYELAAGEPLKQQAAPLDGATVLPLLSGDLKSWPDTVLAEILCECTFRPSLMIRRGRFKYIYCDSDPMQLFDLEADPSELKNESGSERYRSIEDEFERTVRDRWDIEAIAKSVRASQEERRFVAAALARGAMTAWDFQPHAGASSKYYRARANANIAGLFRDGLVNGVISLRNGDYVHEGRVIGHDPETVQRFLALEPEIANAIERQVIEAKGFL